jgi:hypothetical protein
MSRQLLSGYRRRPPEVPPEWRRFIEISAVSDGKAIWVAAEMRAGGAYAHSTLALDAADHANGPRAT